MALVDMRAVTETSPSVHRAFVCTDIVASTSSLIELGNDAWSELISHHRESIAVICQRHKGKIVGFTGDGFMLAFCNDVDAVAFALRLQYALWVQRILDVRVGAGSGDVVAVEETFIGLAVNLASRLCDLCGPGEVRITNECYERAAQKIAVPSLECMVAEVKGIGEPVAVRFSPSHGERSLS